MMGFFPSRKGCQVWLTYKEYKDLELVTRAGFGVCGAYPFDPNNAVWKEGNSLPPESDLEHTAGVMKLVRLIHWNYPDIIPSEKLDDYLFGAEIHEMGERLTGDILDDGTRNEKQKDAEETIEIMAHLHRFAPDEEYIRGMQIYSEFRDKSTEFGRILYCIDKTDAILQALFFELKGQPCLLRYKEENFGGISNKDKQNIEKVCSDNIVDCWSYGLYEKAQHDKYEHIDIFMEIIQSAVYAVRGEPLLWTLRS